MNVQEINGSGTRILTFVITAIVLTIVALGSWGVTDVLRRWRQTEGFQGVYVMIEDFVIAFGYSTRFWIRRIMKKVFPAWSR